ncbi:phage tail tip protein J-related protein, partial [Salmonella enterica]
MPRTPGYFQITVTPHQTVYDASVQYEFWTPPRNWRLPPIFSQKHSIW